MALVEYQSGVVYGGRGNYQSQLMGSKSGAGSGTPFMGLQLGAEGLGATFRHDVRAFLGHWDSIRRDHGVRGKTWALWAEAWDGDSSLASARLDPAFIPLARLVRLGPPVDGLYGLVWFHPSRKPRVDDHTEGGNLGDIFVPLVPHPRSGAPKVRGTLEKGYDYNEVVRLLFGAGRPGVPSVSVQRLSPRKDDEQRRLCVVFEGIAFGQGKTFGFHSRTVMLPESRSKLDLLRDSESVERAHAEMFQMVSDAKRALRGAIRILLHGEPRRREADDDKVERTANALERRVDQIYLDHLFDAAEEMRGDELRRTKIVDWGDRLAVMAREEFEHGAKGTPGTAATALENQVRAENYLNWKLRNLAPEEPGPAGGATPEQPAARI